MHYYNEIDPYCCKVLRARIADGSLPDGYVDERDIRDVRPSDLAGYRQCHFFAGIGGFALGLKWAGADGLPIWTGGFPCQDISSANYHAEGIAGERSGLWAEYARLIRGIRPRYLIAENVAALTFRGLDVVLADLAACGCDAEWQTISAQMLGAPHERDRIFIVAYPTGERCEANAVFARRPPETASEKSAARVRRWPGQCERSAALPNRIRWCPDRELCRVVNGLPDALDRYRALGNAIVPQIAEWIGRRMMDADPLTPRGAGRG